MMIFRNLRSGVSALALLAVFGLLALHTTGCSGDATDPVGAPTAQAPALPDPETLSFDFHFFDGAADLEKGAGIHDNFINAYLRAVVLQAVAELTLAAPVGTFAVALHTVPVAQEDGAWVWSYTWTGYRYPIRVALRGLPAGDHVQWEMRVGAGNAEPTELWFEGSTSGDGHEGRWLFHDLDDPARPVCGEIAWGRDEAGRFLRVHQPRAGEQRRHAALQRRRSGLRHHLRARHRRASSFIRWHADGTGSLQVPDYNGGAEACWDTWQENVVCD